MTRFLEVNEIWEWCSEREVTLTERSRVAIDGSFESIGRLQYAAGEPSGREPVVARHLVEQLGEWDECLLWVVQWGVWDSSEDWPAYYAARGTLGEKRSIASAPGLLVARSALAFLEQFVGLAMRYGWDADVLPALGGKATDRRAFISHDEWAELRGRSA